MLTTFLAILTTIVLAWATGFGAYLWDTSDRIASRLTIAAVGLMIALIYFAQQRPAPDPAPIATVTPPTITGSLPAQSEHSSIAPRRTGKKREAAGANDNFIDWLMRPPGQPKAP